MYLCVCVCVCAMLSYQVAFIDLIVIQKSWSANLTQSQRFTPRFSLVKFFTCFVLFTSYLKGQ